MPKIPESFDRWETVYFSEAGIDTQSIDWYDTANQIKDEMLRRQEWNDIFDSAETNPALQSAIEHVKVLYHLSKR
jgi:hypothetical protein